MTTYYYPSYSLRDQYRMGSSSSKHRSRHSHKKFKPLPIDYFNSAEREYITTLPPEIQFQIFDNLDPVSSTCYGLSSKKVYPLHRSKHRKVSLFEGSQESKIPLALYLKEWAPQDLLLDWETEKLVSKERYAALQKDRERKYWAASAYNSGHTQQWSTSQPSRYQQLYQPYHEPSPPRLKRRRRLERHDIWSCGRRLRSWAF